MLVERTYMSGNQPCRFVGEAPKISVVMAVFNGQSYLQQALDSLASQTCANFELIVVDDGSTDNTSAILRSQKDTRLRLISLERNVGLAEALNLGFSEAQGEFVARMDADDVAYPGRLEAQFERMNREPDLVLLGTAFDYIDANGRIIKTKLLRTDDPDIRRHLFADGNQFCHPSVMMRNDAFQRVGGYRTVAGRLAQDYDLWLRLVEVGKAANLSMPHLGYRVHRNQSSVSKLFRQRRAAELYKVLARQRRGTGCEDTAMALQEVVDLDSAWKLLVANDCLHWGELFSQSGDRFGALLNYARAILVSLGSPAVSRKAARMICDELKMISNWQNDKDKKGVEN